MEEKTLAGLLLIGLIILIIGIIIWQKLWNKKKIAWLEEGDMKYTIVSVDRGKFSDGIQTVLENVDYAMPTWRYVNKRFEYFIEEGKHEFHVRISREPISPFKKGRVRPFYETVMVDIDTKYKYQMSYDFENKTLNIEKRAK